MTSRNWTVDAVCARTDHEAWFPEKGSTPRQAKAMCDTCPVMGACLQWALDNNERWGVWGGKTYDERVKLRRAANEGIAA
jgi:WhiB family redox-sensing transcriptional regulator